ncbi:6-pyruvoyl tetrahydrobiopterin synthase [Onthophagus taurus]|uniref:6-pyruvoyl tetrahydrobiopterin synthase n=1 Tax=Onthophagus taurus TaxID=166361 RepID=UPI000C20F716|nr:6-pyruvoyl tetrahydrobiopterin synthase [Onthophagus taurus]
MSVPKAYITRRCHFSAAHRLHSSRLNQEENSIIYGKCNHPHGHGHNYTVEVTLFGPVDPITGMVENLTILKQYMDAAIMNEMDHKNLDKDVEFFFERPSTTENVALFIWSRIRTMMEKPQLLYEVKVYETENNIVSYRGE